MKVYAKTDIGNCREENQDNYWVGELDNSAIAVVLCDGMGGQNAGDCRFRQHRRGALHRGGTGCPV